MTYSEIQEKIAAGCDTREEWLLLQKEVLEAINNLSAEEKEEMIDSGMTEMLSMIISAFEEEI